MRVLIADDEPVAIERLRVALSCIPEVEIVAAARNGREALALIRELEPDLAILDVQMPGHTGFGILSKLGQTDKAPEVIFVTAFDEHAVEAFEVQAVDYLLKPVGFERLREAVRRAQRRHQSRAADERFAELQTVISALSQTQSEEKPYVDRELWIRTTGGLTRIQTEDVDHIEAAGDYVLVHVGEAAHLLTESMSSLERRVDPAILTRVHRSSMVNLAKVRTLRRMGPRKMSLVMQSGRTVSVGPSYVETVLTKMNAKRWRSSES